MDILSEQMGEVHFSPCVVAIVILLLANCPVTTNAVAEHAKRRRSISPKAGRKFCKNDVEMIDENEGVSNAERMM